jgi:hypothetical protein
MDGKGAWRDNIFVERLGEHQHEVSAGYDSVSEVVALRSANTSISFLQRSEAPLAA